MNRLVENVREALRMKRGADHEKAKGHRELCVLSESLARRVLCDQELKHEFAELAVEMRKKSKAAAAVRADEVLRAYSKRIEALLATSSGVRHG